MMMKKNVNEQLFYNFIEYFIGKDFSPVINHTRT